jgi:hypothetical protein
MLHGLSRRILILIVFVLVLTPITLYFIQAVRTPVLHAGDRLERRVCRDCGGDGKNFGMEGPVPPMLERCPACGGDGEVDVILPGPNRPTRIRGAVSDKGTLGPFATYDDVRPGGPRILERPVGTIGGAPIRFERHDGTVFDVEANPYGLFHTQLPPGSYRVKAAAPGFQPLAADFEVPVLTEEIWIDEAIIVRELGSTEEAQGKYGFELLIALSPDDWDESHLVVNHAGPAGAQ